MAHAENFRFYLNKASYNDTYPELIDMQYEVDSTTQTPENGQNPTFWRLESFKNAFLRFFMDLHGLVTIPNDGNYLVPSKYGLPSRSNRPN